VLGDDSRKATLSDQADVARFLVYDVETTFNWRSVLLTGTIAAVPDDEREAIEAEMDTAWRPNVFERARESTVTGLYAFHIEDRAGIEQLELPPELRDESSMSSP
jgi:nitroimidazol reductase NimA-like FMN-containing flavoprotein (pyridoxamine 5'-phosphate oxidase superfamily)